MGTTSSAPGLITGAADDDPSGIATYSQAGAQFGFLTLWAIVFTYPLMVGIQMVSARIGRVTGHGLASNIGRHFPRPVLYSIVALLVVANTINIAADIAAMGEALRLLVGGPPHVYVGRLRRRLPAAAGVPAVPALRPLSQVADAGVARRMSCSCSRSTFPGAKSSAHAVTPHFALTAEYLTVIVAVFGTTISPYLFFWQASQEVEELNADPAAGRARARARRRRRAPAADQDRHLPRHGVLQPRRVLHHPRHRGDAERRRHHRHPDLGAGGRGAAARSRDNSRFLLFSLGIIGTGMIAVPVLAGSAAYAVAETFEWKRGLDLKLLEAREFYAIIALATLGGVALDFSPIDPIKALFWSAVINGVIAVPIMVVMMLLADDSKVMGTFTVTRRLKALGWLATGTMAAAVVAMFATW